MVSYSAFGPVNSSTGSSVNPYRYVGQWGYYDDGARGSQSGLLLLGVRYYSVAHGRFWTWDPVPNLALYGYADASPTMLIDPSGEVIPLAAAAVAAAVGGLLGLLGGCGCGGSRPPKIEGIPQPPKMVLRCKEGQGMEPTDCDKMCAGFLGGRDWNEIIGECQGCCAEMYPRQGYQQLACAQLCNKGLTACACRDRRGNRPVAVGLSLPLVVLSSLVLLATLVGCAPPSENRFNTIIAKKIVLVDEQNRERLTAYTSRSTNGAVDVTGIRMNDGGSTFLSLSTSTLMGTTIGLLQDEATIMINAGKKDLSIAIVPKRTFDSEGKLVVKPAFSIEVSKDGKVKMTEVKEPK